MDRIAELLSRINDLNAEELEELAGLIDSEFASLDAADPTPETIASLQTVVDAAEQVAAERTRRTEEAEAAATRAEELRSRMHAIQGEGGSAEGDEGDGSTAEGETTEGDESGEGDGAGTDAGEQAGAPTASAPARAAASAGRAARMSHQQRPARLGPEAEAPRSGATLTASAALVNELGNGPVTDRLALGAAMANALRRMDRNGAPRGNVMVASASWEYPEDRRLGQDAYRNTEIMDAVTSPAAIVASGGICAPVNVDYSVPTWSTAERPLRDGLPPFSADRGGLTYVTPPQISGLLGATEVWTEATDADPGDATKPVLVVACGDSQTVYVDAIPTRLQFGNMQSRFAPEQIAANTDLAIAAAAQVAELNLLSLIDASSTTATSAALLGASRDLLTALDLSISAYRFRNRFPRTLSLTAIFPDWAKDLIRLDIAREIAHDDSGTPVRAVPDAMIESWFSMRGVNVIWTLDGRPSYSGGTDYAAQTFATQSTNAALVSFPAEVVWNLFVEGTFTFLDGGRLDLGIVRDSTLDSTNDYETFVETFEGVAFRGYTAYKIVSTVCPTGGSAGTVDTSSICS